MLIGPWAGLEKVPLDWLNGTEEFLALGHLAAWFFRFQGVFGLKVEFHWGPAPVYLGIFLPLTAMSNILEVEFPNTTPGHGVVYDLNYTITYFYKGDWNMCIVRAGKVNQSCRRYSVSWSVIFHQPDS